MIALAVGTTVAAGAALAVAYRTNTKSKTEELYSAEAAAEEADSDNSTYEDEYEGDYYDHDHHFEPLTTQTPSFTFAGSAPKKQKTKMKSATPFHSCPACDAAAKEQELRTYI